MVTLAARVVRAPTGVTTTNRDGNGLSRMATTGSITAGTNSLVVANTLDFRIGDWIIVQTGGEAGAGARGTAGVGGTYPDLSYANAAAMNADTSQDADTFCWLQDTGQTYYWKEPDNAWTLPYGYPNSNPASENDWYLNKAVPKALWAEITNISGTTLTLSKNADTTATNANVYFDNWGIFQELMKRDLAVYVQPGTYQLSDSLYFEGYTDRKIIGAGLDVTVLRSPNGCTHAGIYFKTSYRIELSDFTINHEFKNDKYAFRYSNGRAVDIGDDNISYREQGNYRMAAQQWGLGIYFLSSQNITVSRVKSLHHGQYAFCFFGCINAWMYNCIVRVVDPIRHYFQWPITFADVPTAGTCGAVDCEFDSDWHIPGIEAVTSRGVTFRRLTSRNGFYSNNSSDENILEDCTFTFDENGQWDDVSSPPQRPILDFTANRGNALIEAANVITNLTVTANPMNAAGERYQVIICNEGASPCIFRGTYQIDDVTPKGLIQVNGPFVEGGTLGGYDGMAMRTGGLVVVENMRFIVEMGEIWNGVALVTASPIFREYNTATTTVTDCVRETGYSKYALTETGTNLTNAEYDAL